MIDSNWWPGLGLALAFLVLDGCVAKLLLMMAMMAMMVMMVMCSHGFPLFIGFIERKMSRKLFF